MITNRINVSLFKSYCHDPIVIIFLELLDELPAKAVSPSCWKKAVRRHSKPWSCLFSLPRILQELPSWWFQPILNVLVNLDNRGEHKKCLSCHHLATLMILRGAIGRSPGMSRIFRS